MLEKILKGEKLKLEALSAIFPENDYSIDILNIENPEKIIYYGSICTEVDANELYIRSINFTYPEPHKLESFLKDHLAELYVFLDQLQKEKGFDRILFDDFFFLNSN